VQVSTKCSLVVVTCRNLQKYATQLIIGISFVYVGEDVNSPSLFSADFTVASYNCGGLSDHYDYIRAVCMQKLAQERYNAEPEAMAQFERIQNTALKILFSKDESEHYAAEKKWSDREYTQLFDRITAHPDDKGSINKIWREKSEQIVSSYDIRPVVIHDEEVNEILYGHLRDLTKGQNVELGPDNHLNDWLDLARRVMVERIFSHQLKYDIICLQEADYLDSSMFPKQYEVEFSNTSRSINGVAWNKKRFELIQVIGNIVGQGFAVELRDLESSKTVLIASGHLKGCNPFSAVKDSSTGNLDSAKGDQGLLTIIQYLDDNSADMKIIAMDSNVTATHPRLSLLKDADYILDYENYLEPTCTNPWQVLNTRIDWIAVKSLDETVAISNIPVLGVNLNSPRTNVSDHKPVAARVNWK